MRLGNIKRVVLVVVIILVLSVGAGVGLGFAFDMYIPIIKEREKEEWNQSYLMDRWKDVRIYEKRENATMDELISDIKDETPDDEVKTEQTVQKENFYSKFNIIDEDSFEKYLSNNPKDIEEGYDSIFIDKADLSNTATGIKTIHGDDVFVIDTYNEIVIVGTKINNVNVKVAIAMNNEQVSLSVADNLTYWEKIDRHATKENAVLAMNASGYNWNKAGDYASLYGATIREGRIIRKYTNQENLIGFTKDGQLSFGAEETIENYYNACEYYPIIINDGVSVFQKEDTEEDEEEVNEEVTEVQAGAERLPRSAIGQTKDGSIIMLVTDYGEGIGLTEEEVADIMYTYGCEKAAMLSNEIKTIMWWNGRIINNCYSYDDGGIKLPNSWVIKYNPEVFR